MKSVPAKSSSHQSTGREESRLAPRGPRAEGRAQSPDYASGGSANPQEGDKLKLSRGETMIQDITMQP